MTCKGLELIETMNANAIVRDTLLRITMENWFKQLQIDLSCIPETIHIVQNVLGVFSFPLFRWKTTQHLKLQIIYKLNNSIKIYYGKNLVGKINENSILTCFTKSIDGKWKEVDSNDYFIRLEAISRNIRQLMKQPDVQQWGLEW